MRNKLNTLEEFRALQTKCIAAHKAETRKVLVCCGTGCMAGGNLALYEELKKEMAAQQQAVAAGAAGKNVNPHQPREMIFSLSSTLSGTSTRQISAPT